MRCYYSFDMERMPALFIGHGSPMNAIEDTAYARAWKALGTTLPRPKAILVISAHWLTEGKTLVHTGQSPRTIHDFWGFPKTLYDVRYPAPGAPMVAMRVMNLIREAKVGSDTEWGLDHGAWSVLRHLYPEADIPTFQMSIDLSEHSSYHYALGRELSVLRDEGVLILGSGNIVHNLSEIDFSPTAQPFPWAVEFDEIAERLIAGKAFEALVEHDSFGPITSRAIPTPDHYWPLLYVLGAACPDDQISFPVTGIQHGSISMRSVRVG